jgi:hypothetical protein
LNEVHLGIERNRFEQHLRLTRKFSQSTVKGNPEAFHKYRNTQEAVQSLYPEANAGLFVDGDHLQPASGSAGGLRVSQASIGEDDLYCGVWRMSFSPA